MKKILIIIILLAVVLVGYLIYTTVVQRNNNTTEKQNLLNIPQDFKENINENKEYVKSDEDCRFACSLFNYNQGECLKSSQIKEDGEVLSPCVIENKGMCDKYGECNCLCWEYVEDGNSLGLANPASVYCEENGGSLEMRETELGTVGYCIFEDGSECEEWAFYHNECLPSSMISE